MIFSLRTDNVAHLLAEPLAGLSFAREDGVLRNLALPTAMGLGCKTLRRGEAGLTGETERSFVLASRCARVWKGCKVGLLFCIEMQGNKNLQ